MANYGGAAKGALGGATAGAALGPIGAAAGGLIGGITGLFGKKKRKPKRISSLDKRQEKINKQQYESILGKGPLADIYNYNPEGANDVFDKTIANPAYRKYKEELAPQITGQFRSNGIINSSYAGDALAKTARDIQEGLDAQRAKYLYGEQSQAREAKRNAVENLQNRQTFAYDTSGTGKSTIDSILGSITPEAVNKFRDFFKKPKLK